ncbi:MAG: replicative DNA helicase [Propionibacteriaceae bacterium]|nr:replicative DNA helicase [Propionibacteriaceae bacterium]
MSVAELLPVSDSFDAPGRLPPQDLSAEQSVLGAMLTSKDVIGEVVEVLRGADFYRPAHEFVFDAIVDLYGRGEPADAITVADELTKRGVLGKVGGHIYLHDLFASVAIAGNAFYYANIVREKALLRRLIEASIKISQLSYAAHGDVDEIVNEAQQAVFSVAEGKIAEDYEPLSKLLGPTVDEIEALYKYGTMAGVPTGFRELDELTNGLHPGQLIIVAARPAVGKSTLGLDLARAAAIQHSQATVFFSLEMTKSEIVMRLISAQAQVKLHNIRRGRLEDGDWNKIANHTSAVSSAPLFIDDSPNMNIMEIRSKARRLKRRNDLKLIIVDYLQLMSSGRRVENRQVEVAEFSRQLKLLAKELEVPVVAISQLNRDVEKRVDKKPLLSDLRESGALEQDADVVILLHREKDSESTHEDAGMAKLIIAKHRNGQTKNLDLVFQGHFSRFAEAG